MNFEDTLATHFPATVTDGEYASRSYAALRAQGFQLTNTFAGVGLCRDEITLPLSGKIREAWGKAFNISSLAGMLFLGTVALHHAPDNDQGTRHIYFAMPHIGINSGGVTGRNNSISPRPAEY
jgi:Limiting CO2-inducible proteins B/C beta carbonyic anhydrases